MKKAVLAIVLLLGLVMSVPASAHDPIDYRYTMTPGTSVTWNGTKITASNQHYWENLDVEGNKVGSQLMDPYTCNKTRLQYCEVALVTVNNPVPLDDADGKLTKNITMRIDTWEPVNGPVTDYDLAVYASDANGTRGDEVAHSYNGATSVGADLTVEEARFPVVTKLAEPTKYYLVRVIYFQTFETGYKGTITF